MAVRFKVEYASDLFPDDIVCSECRWLVMADGPIIDIGNLSEPAKVLIEKVSDGIGGAVKPYQIKRVAKAEAEAEIIKTLGKIKATELQQRAIHRLIAEEAKHQANMESITEKAIGYLKEDAHPEKVEDDWISNFFDKCRLVSDEEMQNLWARVLAGEANKPGRCSKRTVNFVASMGKPDATLFTKLCSYVCVLGPQFVCLIYDLGNNIYSKNSINFGSLMHLDEIGLVAFDNTKTFHMIGLPRTFTVLYYDTPIRVTFGEDDRFATGCVFLSQMGKELVPIAGSEPIPEFVDYVIDVWSKKGYTVSREKPLERGSLV
jgi:hypothetical protein